MNRYPRADFDRANHADLPTAGRRRRLLRWLCAAPAVMSGAFAMPFGSARAQAFPTHPLRLIVPFPAGGGTDAISRLAAEHLAARLGQPMVVMNKAGAAGGIASEFVAAEPADGYTVLVAGQGQMFINKALGRKLGYDPDNDFSFVGMLGAFPNIVLVNPDVIPARTIGEFIQLAKDKPGSLTYGSNGIGSLAHLTTEVLAEAAGVKFVHVPYKGSAPQVADLLSGRIGFSITGPQGMLPHVKEGKLRALAVSSGTRYDPLPDVPTLVESGFPALDAPVWFAAYVRASTPPAVLAQLRAALAEVNKAPEYASGLAKVGAQRLKVAPEEAASHLAEEKKMWVDAVERTGAKGG